MNFIKYKKGFSLIELLVVISIFTLLIFLGFISYHTFENQTALATATEGIENILRQTQANAQAVINANRHGVYFDTKDNQYIIFEGDSQASAISETTYPMPENTEIISTTLVGAEIVFEKLTGTPLSANSGTITVGSIRDTDLVKTISVTSEGKISID